ncbi:MAG: SPFH domain-containing protein, partial [Caldilineae bacterium]
PDEYRTSWFHERFPPEQLTRYRNYQWRAFLRRILFLLALLTMLIPAYFFNRAVFGDRMSPLWVLAGLLPGLLAALFMLAMDGLFVKEVFALPSWRQGFGFALLCLFGMPRPLKYPFAVVENGVVRKRDRGKCVASREIGGPGRLIIGNDSAVVLSRFGRITRIEGPGPVFLGRFERIRKIIDLRPQERTVAATVYTKDGIALNTDITVRFQIQCNPPEEKAPYPADADALERAAHADARRWVSLQPGALSRMDWPDRVMGNVESTLREMVAGMTLDEVFAPGDIEKDPRDEISRQMLIQLREKSKGFGAYMLDVILGPFKPADPAVEEQRRESWEALHRAEALAERARGEAQALLARETAYAYAQLEMILTIDRGFQQLAQQGQHLPARFIALRFVEMLRRIASNPRVGPLLPRETVDTLGFLHDYLLNKPATDNTTAPPPAVPLPDNPGTGGAA